MSRIIVALSGGKASSWCADWERVEREVSKYLGKDVHFFKDESLESFRKRIE